MKKVLATWAMSAFLLASGASVRAAHADDQNAGMLDVSSDPTAAEIFIDGGDTHLRTPQTMRLPVGHHQLQLKMDDGRESHIGFTVAAGKTTTLKMKPTLKPR